MNVNIKQIADRARVDRRYALKVARLLGIERPATLARLAEVGRATADSFLVDRPRTVEKAEVCQEAIAGELETRFGEVLA
jgi:hypothetical protein